MPATPTQEALNIELRVLMVRRAVTQQDVAERLGITQTQVSSRLRGGTDWKFVELVEVAELFGVPLAEIVAAAAGQSIAAARSA